MENETVFVVFDTIEEGTLKENIVGVYSTRAEAGGKVYSLALDKCRSLSQEEDTTQIMPNICYCHGEVMWTSGDSDAWHMYYAHMTTMSSDDEAIKGIEISHFDLSEFEQLGPDPTSWPFIM